MIFGWVLKYVIWLAVKISHLIGRVHNILVLKLDFVLTQ